MKDYEKICSILGDNTIKEMQKMSVEQLQNVVLKSNQTMKEVQDEIEKNEKYEEIKSQKAAIESSKKEVDRREKARIKFALHLLETKEERKDLLF